MYRTIQVFCLEKDNPLVVQGFSQQATRNGVYSRETHGGHQEQGFTCEISLAK